MTTALLPSRTAAERCPHRDSTVSYNYRGVAVSSPLEYQRRVEGQLRAAMRGVRRTISICYKCRCRERIPSELAGDRAALPHQVGHDQSWGSAPAGAAVDQNPPCSVPVDPLSHRVKVVSEGGVRLILDGDMEDLQAV